MEVSPDKKKEGREVVAITNIAVVATVSVVSVVSVVSRTVQANGNACIRRNTSLPNRGYKTMDTKHYI